MTYQRRIPSLTLSYKPLPSLSMGSKCFRWLSLPKLVLVQSENANCSSIRTWISNVTHSWLYVWSERVELWSVTEWVVPSEEAADIPPMVSKFSRLVTTCLKVVATSFDLSPAQSWIRQSCNKSTYFRGKNDQLPLRIVRKRGVLFRVLVTGHDRLHRSSVAPGTAGFWTRTHPAPASIRPIRCNPIHRRQSIASK